MLRIKRLANGNLIVPMRAESEDCGIIGDALTEIGPEHPQFAAWEEWARKNSEDAEDSDQPTKTPTSSTPPP
jgi:hypothetical protein